MKEQPVSLIQGQCFTLGRESTKTEELLANHAYFDYSNTVCLFSVITIPPLM